MRRLLLMKFSCSMSSCLFFASVPSFFSPLVSAGASHKLVHHTDHHHASSSSRGPNLTEHNNSSLRRIELDVNHNGVISKHKNSFLTKKEDKNRFTTEDRWTSKKLHKEQAGAVVSHTSKAFDVEADEDDHHGDSSSNMSLLSQQSKSRKSKQADYETWDSTVSDAPMDNKGLKPEKEKTVTLAKPQNASVLQGGPPRMKSIVKTFCIISPDGDTICPNDRQREAAEEHIKQRQVFLALSMSLVAVAFFISQFLDQTVVSFLKRNTKLLVRIRDIIVGQCFLVAVLYVFVAVGEAGGMWRRWNVWVFGEVPPVFDLSMHSVGDVREGHIQSEILVLVDSVLHFLAFFMITYIVFCSFIAIRIQFYFNEFASWETTLNELVLVHDEQAKDTGTYAFRRFQFLAYRRMFTSPRDIFQTFSVIQERLDNPTADFKYSWYLTECMADAVNQVLTFPAITLFLLVVYFFLEVVYLHSQTTFSESDTGLDFSLNRCMQALVVASIVVFICRLQVKGIFADMTPSNGWFRWVIATEAKEGRNKANLTENPTPLDMIPFWKQAEFQKEHQEHWYNMKTRGTFEPTKQEALWPFWRNGPAFYSGLVQNSFFALIVFSAYMLRNLSDYLYSEKQLTYSDTCVVIVAVTFVFMSIASWVPSFLVAFTFTAYTDQMGDANLLEDAVVKMRMHRTPPQILLVSIHMVLLCEQFDTDPQSNLDHWGKILKLHFTQKELTLYEEAFRKYTMNKYKGCSNKELQKILDVLQLRGDGTDVFSWKWHFSLREEGYLSMEEFKCLLYARNLAINERETMLNIKSVLQAASEDQKVIKVKEIQRMLEMMGVGENESFDMAIGIMKDIKAYFEEGPGMLLNVHQLDLPFQLPGADPPELFDPTDDDPHEEDDVDFEKAALVDEEQEHLERIENADHAETEEEKRKRFLNGRQRPKFQEDEVDIDEAAYWLTMQQNRRKP